MKGMIFTEFLDFVEDRISTKMADHILDRADLESGGAYTSVGNYDYREMLNLIEVLSEETGHPASFWLHNFGEHLFGRLAEIHPEFFAGVESTFELLQNVDNHIHVQVCKLYPHAEVPTLDYELPAEGQMRVIYRSSRPFADLAEGLIHGCANYFGEPLTVAREDLDEDRMPGTSALFSLTSPVKGHMHD